MYRDELIKNIDSIMKQEFIFKKQRPNEYEYICSNSFGLSFSQKLYNYIHGIKEYPICLCDTCNNQTTYFSFNYGYKKYCSKECEKSDISQIKKNYSIEQKKDIQSKRKSTCIELYGVDNVAKSDIIQNKTELTNLKRYGVKAPTQNIDILIKRAKNNKEKWGVEYLTQLPDLMTKMSLKRKDTINKQIIEKYKLLGFNVLDFKNGEITCLCPKCEKDYTTNIYIVYQRHKANLNTCIICHPLGDFQESQFQKSICEYLDTLNVQYETSNRTVLKGKELDIYIPSHNLAIECNGIYWHNELYKTKDYHRNKYLGCKENGIQLIQVWQDDWTYKNDIIKSRISSKLKGTTRIWARKCEIRQIDFSETMNFLAVNHLQGSIPSKVNIGLYYEKELVSVMSFSKVRKSLGNKISDNYELLRFCNKLNTTVVGAADKMFKKFLMHYEPKGVISYANLEWGEGDFYKKLGFERKGDTEIGYSYIDKGIKRHRFNYRKDILVKQGYDENKTEHDIMLERKIYRVYHSGNAIWTFNI